MKFEYESKRNINNHVAFIDADGDLWINNGLAWVCVSGPHENDIIIDGIPSNHKFYPGDKITITF